MLDVVDDVEEHVCDACNDERRGAHIAHVASGILRRGSGPLWAFVGADDLKCKPAILGLSLPAMASARPWHGR